jgi:hypothetical protein
VYAKRHTLSTSTAWPAAVEVEAADVELSLAALLLSEEDEEDEEEVAPAVVVVVFSLST